MSDAAAELVASWLRDLKHILYARPIKVKLKRAVYYGAVYCTPYETRTYLLGRLSKSRKSAVYVWDCNFSPLPPECSSVYWSLVGYYENQPTEYHPWGAFFSLLPMPNANEVSLQKRISVPMLVTYLDQ